MSNEALTPREQEVLVYVLMGLENVDIADKLEVGKGRVRSMTNFIYKKYDVHSKGELMALFINRPKLNEEISVMLDPDYERKEVNDEA
jgi:DNA-binding NarL/FixJ family response regulator